MFQWLKKKNAPDTGQKKESSISEKAQKTKQDSQPINPKQSHGTAHPIKSKTESKGQKEASVPQKHPSTQSAGEQAHKAKPPSPQNPQAGRVLPQGQIKQATRKPQPTEGQGQSPSKGQAVVKKKVETHKHIETTKKNRCPACEDELLSITYSGESVRQCETCSGYWCPEKKLDIISKKPEGSLDRKLFVKLKVLAESRITEEQGEPSRKKCPECGTNLVAWHYKNVVALSFERCEKGCGNWVDRSTLEKIQVLEQLGI